MSGGRNAEEPTQDSNWFLEIYRRYLGEPDQLIDIYVGFGLFFGGIAIAILGLLLFLVAMIGELPLELVLQLNETAISLAMIGLPAFLLSVTVLLPVDRRAIIGGSVGGLICLGGIAIFVANYPDNWNVVESNASAVVVTIYSIGVVLASSAVGAALVSLHISRSQPEIEMPSSPARSSTIQESSETVSEEQVREDIDEALSSADITWGGVEKDTTKSLSIQVDEPEVDSSGFDTEAVAEHRSVGSEVDNAVEGLNQLRGGQVKQASGEGTDDQTEALQQLRQQDAQEQLRSDESYLQQVRNRLGL